MSKIPDQLTVSISGPALSFLLYENLKSEFGQEGFLLGHFVQRETTNISDSDQGETQVSKTIKINSCFPCPKMGYFYDGTGRVNFIKLRTFLGVHFPQVVAWYTYKPSSSCSRLNLQLTFRERLIHRQMASFLKMPFQHFACCILKDDGSDGGSTRSFTHSFVRLVRRKYETLPLFVDNLSVLDVKFKNPEPVSDGFDKILHGLKIDHDKERGLSVIVKVHKALQKHTDGVVRKLADAEKRLFLLEKEVKEMQAAIREKQFRSEGRPRKKN